MDNTKVITLQAGEIVTLVATDGSIISEAEKKNKTAKSQTKASRKWNETNYFRVALTIPKEWENELKQYAEDNNITVNKLLNNYIANILNKDTNTSINKSIRIHKKSMI